MTPAPPDEVLVATRLALHQVAVHVLARRRFAVTHRLGLRPAPGGVATPAFGDHGEVVRVSGTALVVERLGGTWAEPLSTLGRAADLAEVDLAADFRVGHDTPPPLDRDAPLVLDRGAVLLLAGWWAFGATVLDEVLASPGADAPSDRGSGAGPPAGGDVGVRAGERSSAPAVTGATTAQLWPEHFDHACTVTLAAAGGVQVDVNLGASPGDTYLPLPYLYVGPHGSERPGDAAYWNAPFGAVLGRADLADLPAADRRVRAAAFLRHGLAVLAGR